ncbi:MAG: class I SAM-dependent methyltransferase [Solirubrobacteraceae bacterium]
MTVAAIRTIDEARLLVGDAGGGTGAVHGAELHRFVREHACESCLELGFASGVGATYIASALEANGKGRLTSVDMTQIAERARGGEELLARGGLSHRVEVVLEHGGYNWFLHRKLREQLRSGAIEPLYDFVYLDGAHTWPEDGFALLLLERLLKPGGWVHLDDLTWLASDRDDFSAQQRSFPHVQEIWDLLVVPNPAFEEMRTDGMRGWARKSLGSGAGTRVVYRQDVVGTARFFGLYVRDRLKAVARRA